MYLTLLDPLGKITVQAYTNIGRVSIWVPYVVCLNRFPIKVVNANLQGRSLHASHWTRTDSSSRFRVPQRLL